MIIRINGRTIEELEAGRLEGLYIPHHTCRWYDRHLRFWIVQLKDRYDNQIDEAVYVYSKQEAINAEKRLKEAIGKEG
jgi:hypothetical protein